MSAQFLKVVTREGPAVIHPYKVVGIYPEDGVSVMYVCHCDISQPPRRLVLAEEAFSIADKLTVALAPRLPGPPGLLDEMMKALKRQNRGEDWRGEEGED